MSMLIVYSLSLGHRFLLEQPSGSSAEWHPRLAALFNAVRVWRTGVWGGYYAHEGDPDATPKRHKLWSNDSELLVRLAAAAGSMTSDQLANLQGQPLVKKQRKEDGTVGFTGVKDLMKKSQLLVCNYNCDIAFTIWYR